MTPDELAPRYRKVAKRLALGQNYREIGTELGLTERTVRHYTNEIHEQIEDSEYADMRPQTGVRLWYHAHLSNAT